MASILQRSVPFTLFPISAALGLALSACSGGSSDDRTFEQQVEAGAALYGDHCADCHGDAGQGTEDAPALVGTGALPEEPPDDRQFRMNNFNTAADIFAFVNEYMPATAPDSVSEAEKVDILAFALSANGVELEEPLTTANADEVVIHE